MFCFRPAIPSVICMRCKRITKATFVCGETCSANLPDRVTLGIVAIDILFACVGAKLGATVTLRAWG